MNKSEGIKATTRESWILEFICDLPEGKGWPSKDIHSGKRRVKLSGVLRRRSLAYSSHPQGDPILSLDEAYNAWQQGQRQDSNVANA